MIQLLQTEALLKLLSFVHESPFFPNLHLIPILLFCFHAQLIIFGFYYDTSNSAFGKYMHLGSHSSKSFYLSIKTSGVVCNALRVEYALLTQSKLSLNQYILSGKLERKGHQKPSQQSEFSQLFLSPQPHLPHVFSYILKSIG